MHAWPGVEVPTLSVTGPAVRIHDTSTGGLLDVTPAQGPARLYVCGITPYDATHFGHANTYLAFDLLNRAWRSAGHEVRYAQNVTDVDDPLLERAEATGVDWRDLAARETDLFRTDMAALRVLPPDHYVGVVEAMPLVVAMIERLQGLGALYAVDTDLYFDISSDPSFGEVSHYDQAQMAGFFAERGGDPDRPGKRHPLDPLVWRGQRPAEPSWESPFGPGRPGWHIECSAIAREYLGAAFEVQGGGSDLVFPHHEMSAAHAEVAQPGERFARAYVHSGMVALDGEKMSKSKGNLELVSRLRERGADPMAIRLALLRHHYREDWEWRPEQLGAAERLLEALRAAVHRPSGQPAREITPRVLAALADDLDAPRAIGLLTTWSAADGDDMDAPEEIRKVADAALGLAL